MKRTLLAFTLGITACVGNAADDDHLLEQRIHAEIDYALSSGIAGVTCSVSASRVWVPVTPSLSTILDREGSERIVPILEHIKKGGSGPEHRKFRSYVEMCLMMFPEKEHAMPSIITFSPGKEESVVFYKIPLARFLGKEPNQSSQLPPASGPRG